MGRRTPLGPLGSTSTIRANWPRISPSGASVSYPATRSSPRRKSPIFRVAWATASVPREDGSMLRRTPLLSGRQLTIWTTHMMRTSMLVRMLMNRVSERCTEKAWIIVFLLTKMAQNPVFQTSPRQCWVFQVASRLEKLWLYIADYYSTNWNCADFLKQFVYNSKKSSIFAVAFEKRMVNCWCSFLHNRLMAKMNKNL